jgi:uncharacterized glyoxalase superfamily protein PhnB
MTEATSSLGPPILWVEDLQRSKVFYQEMMGMSISHEDATSVGLILGGDMILLVTLESAADMLLGEPVITPKGLPTTSEYCLFVDDVDAWYERLLSRGVEFFIKPMNRDWGRRTAHLRDPDGWVWEISQSI